MAAVAKRLTPAGSPRANAVVSANAHLIRPQPGPQTRFLSSSADIVIYGGGAGGGKSWSLLMEALRHKDNQAFGVVIFRRTLADVKKQGSLWDTSVKMFGPIRGVIPNLQGLFWRFPSGARVTFGHLEHESTVYDWQGAQIGMLGFDELTHFSLEQFLYMLTRNRSVSGVTPYVRATTNPDSESWVRSFIDWWIGPDGFPIPERDGRIRWFARVDEQFVWAETKAELLAAHPDVDPYAPKSVTFIKSLVTDNRILMKEDPGYRGNISLQSRVERERLLNGNWNIRAAGGMFYDAAKVPYVDAVPANIRWYRGWDLAGTKPHDGNRDPDWTVGVLVGESEGVYYLGGMVELRDNPGEVQALIKSTAERDDARTKGRRVRVAMPRDPGQAGKDQELAYGRILRGHTFTFRPVAGRGNKVERFELFSAQVMAGNVRMVREAPGERPWNERLHQTLESFPEGAHDDHADATAEAFNSLLTNGSRDSWSRI